MTPEMRRTLTFIQDYCEQNGVPPTFSEIMADMGGHSKSSVHRRVHALVDRGYLVQEGRGRARGFRPAGVDLTNVPTEKLLGELEKRRALHG